MNLITKLVKLVPTDTTELTLEVNSVDGVLSDAHIYETYVNAGVIFNAKRKRGEDVKGHIRGGILRTYPNYLRACAEACAYFSARGIETHLVDSKAEGKYIPANQRGL